MSSFCLSSAGEPIGPDLKEMSKYGCVQILENDNLLTCVTVEPLVLFFDVVFWVSSVCKVGLASATYAPVPLSSNFGSGERLEL